MMKLLRSVKQMAMSYQLWKSLKTQKLENQSINLSGCSQGVKMEKEM